MYTSSQPALVLVLPLLVLFQPTHNKRHLDRRRRTLPLQWRDPCISSLLLSLLLLLFLPLLVLCRHSERSEESPHLRGERSDPSAFSSPKNIVIQTGVANCLIVSCGAEKPASLPPLSPSHNCLCLLLPIPYSLLPVF